MKSPGQVMTDVVTLRVPGHAQYIGLVRLAVAGLANQFDFPFDDAEDLKLAVTETCSHILSRAKASVDLQVGLRFTGESLAVTVRSVAHPRRIRLSVVNGADCTPEMDFDVGMSLVEALMDTFDMETDENTGNIEVAMSRRFSPKQSREG